MTIDTNNTVTTLVDNGNGSFTYTSEDGTVTTFTETLSTLVDNANGTFTYTNEDGVATTFDAKIASVVDNVDGTYTITDDFGTAVTIDTNNTVTTLVDNGNGSFTYTSEDGTVTTFTETLSTLVDNANGTFTYTNEDGVTTSFDGTDNQTATEVSYDNTSSLLAAVNVQDAIDELNGLAGTVALADNGDGTYTFTDAAGNITLISDTSISTLVNNGDATFTYTNEAGTTVTINLISSDANNDIVAGSDGGLYLNVASVTISETITDLTDNNDGTFTYVNENGISQTVSKANITDNTDGTYTFTNNDGSDVIINTNGVAVSNTVAGNRIATITDAGGTINDINETLSTLVDNANGTFIYTNEVGVATTFDAKISSVVDNTDGTYTITDDFGTAVTIDTNNTDAQTIALNNTTNILTLGNGTAADTTVDLSGYVSTDDQ
ncbi:beta strand repeat-containing protein, partial [Maribacter sp. CXY002]|uniref:beta strand repeat-containing protein n=1 Tax=Maribacter luteocoastalis TaxID=3407671 RepID=UPI003B680B9E